MTRTSEAALWRKRAHLYEDELVRLRNTYAVLANGCAGKKSTASFAKAFNATVEIIDAVLAKGRARVSKDVGPLIKQDTSCPVNCGHDDSSWCNEKQVAEFERRKKAFRAGEIDTL